MGVSEYHGVEVAGRHMSREEGLRLRELNPIVEEYLGLPSLNENCSSSDLAR